MRLKELRTMLDSRKIGTVELTNEYLKRINTYDKKINSYITVCPDEALSSAKAAQKAIDSGCSSALTGIPISIKDNICTKDIRTTCASKMLSDFVPVYDATVIERLKLQHAVILGKTNMDEFAMGASSQNSYFGAVKNPYDTKYIAGGSSGGAAASVLSGLCMAALGSDTGGSVRQPASFCGVTGLKPTYGAVSRWGLIAFASSLDQIGIIGNCAEDTGFILDCIAGYDKNDATSSSLSGGNYTDKIGEEISGVKIGLPKEFFGDEISDEVKTAVIRASEYYRLLGCEIIDCSLPSLKYAVSAYYLISSAEAASNLSRFDGIKYGFRSDTDYNYSELIKASRRDGFGKEVKRRIMLGNYALCSGYYDKYYKNALRIRTRLKQEYADIFKKCDVILTPTAPTAAYKADLKISPSKMYAADICTVSVNIAGLPAISTTCGYDKNNMPIGMSLIGKPFDERTIISVCDAFEQNFERREAIL